MGHRRTRVKMCGMTRAQDIAYAVDLGVDAVGLIFYASSPRHVTLATASALVHTVPPFVAVVAVLVNPDEHFVHTLLRELPLQLLQFHGEENAAFCEQFNRPYLKAVQAHTAQHIQQAAQAFSTAQALLLDTPSATVKGGTGRPFDWQQVPADLPMPCILAGGLHATNVGQAIATCRPYAVDVCSGIESTAGIKDNMKMQAFMNAVEVNNA